MEKRDLVDPVKWSTKTLISLGDQVIHDLALNCVGIDTAYRVTLGRCLLAIDQTGLYRKFGCSGAVHYGTAILGLGTRHARSLKRVANALESLPLLSQAAQEGEIPWGKLREITSKASPETEAAWLQLSRRHSYWEIERLVRSTEPGQLPWEDCVETESAARLKLHFNADMGEVFERARALLSQRYKKPITVVETLEHLSLELLAGKKLTEKRVTQARQDARRGAFAAKHKHARLIQRAKESEECLDDSQLLNQALGSSPLSLPETNEFRVNQTLDDESTDIAAEPAVGTSNLENDRFTDGRVENEQVTLVSSSDSHPLDSGESNHTPPRPARVISNWTNPRLRFNPKARGTTPAQRLEILPRDGHCCSTPGCPNKLWLELHHAVPFAQRGPTVPPNLLTLCSRCHRHHHEGVLRIEGSTEEGYTFTDSQGRNLAREQRIQIAGWVNFWLGWEGGSQNCHISRWAMSA